MPALGNEGRAYAEKCSGNADEGGLPAEVKRADEGATREKEKITAHLHVLVLHWSLRLSLVGQQMDQTSLARRRCPPRWLPTLVRNESV